MARTRPQHVLTLPEMEQPAAVPEVVARPPEPAAPPEVVARPPETPTIRFDAIPRTVTIEGSSGPAHVIVMWPSDQPSRDAFSQLIYDAPKRLQVALLQVREAFFASGPGATLRVEESRLADVERAASEAETNLNYLRLQWKTALATESDEGVQQIEQMLAERERDCVRLTTKRDAFRERIGPARKDAANLLHRVLLDAIDQFEEDRSAKVATFAAKLNEVVAPIYAELIEAALECEGVHSARGNRLRLLASSAPDVPRSEKHADPVTLPDLVFPPQQTDEERRAFLASLPHPAGGPILSERARVEMIGDRKPGDVVDFDGVKMIVGLDGYLSATPQSETVPAGGYRGELYPGEFAGVDDER